MGLSTASSQLAAPRKRLNGIPISLPSAARAVAEPVDGPVFPTHSKRFRANVDSHKTNAMLPQKHWITSRVHYGADFFHQGHKLLNIND
jgi:hypothetical protein